MMSSTLDTNHVGVQQLSTPSGHVTDSMLNELSRHIAASNSARRLSRGTGSQRAGNGMRIGKPGSANNSPRSAVLPSRRRTVIGEGLARPNLQLVDTNLLPTPGPEAHFELGYEPERRQARPMSWHPPSHQLPQQPIHPQQYQAQVPYAFPNHNDGGLLTSYQQFPSTPAAYSGYASPASAFSPLSLPYSNLDSNPYCSPGVQSIALQQTHQPLPALACQHSPSHLSIGAVSPCEFPYLPAPKVTTTSVGSLDWDSFAAHGFDKYAAPPTPEDFVAHAAATKTAAIETIPKVAADDDAIPYDPLDDDESEGEILYGMGLYDAPEKDSMLDFHRSTVFSLLGGAYPEPTGKGLKLEDAWEPPVSDDEEEEEEDAEGEARDEE